MQSPQSEGSGQPPLAVLVHSIPSAYRNFVAGAMGGTVAAIVTCPLDVLKTRLQSSAGASLRHFSPWGLGASIVRQEGTSALWKGLTPTVLGVGPARAINFAVYAKAKSTLESWGLHGSRQHLLAAACAGFCTVTTTSPIWAPPSTTYRGFFHAAGSVWRTEGIRGLFRGVSASYLGISEGMLQFTLYEAIKVWTARQLDVAPDAPMSPLVCLAQGATAKVCASCVTYPHEVIRTRLRQVGSFHNMPLFKAFVAVWRQEGAAGLYGGLGVHLMRTVPNAAILFLVVEALTGI